MVEHVAGHVPGVVALVLHAQQLQPQLPARDVLDDVAVQQRGVEDPHVLDHLGQLLGQEVGEVRGGAAAAGDDVGHVVDHRALVVVVVATPVDLDPVGLEQGLEPVADLAPLVVVGDAVGTGRVGRPVARNPQVIDGGIAGRRHQVGLDEVVLIAARAELVLGVDHQQVQVAVVEGVVVAVAVVRRGLEVLVEQGVPARVVVVARRHRGRAPGQHLVLDPEELLPLVGLVAVVHQIARVDDQIRVPHGLDHPVDHVLVVPVVGAGVADEGQAEGFVGHRRGQEAVGRRGPLAGLHLVVVQGRRAQPGELDLVHDAAAGADLGGGHRRIGAEVHLAGGVAVGLPQHLDRVGGHRLQVGADLDGRPGRSRQAEGEDHEGNREGAHGPKSTVSGPGCHPISRAGPGAALEGRRGRLSLV